MKNRSGRQYARAQTERFRERFEENVTNTTHKRARQTDNTKHLNRARRVTSIGIFICGTIFGLYVVHWFVVLLPGPKPYVNLNGLKVTSGNAAGCTLFQFTLSIDDPVDFVYMKIQFPSKITAYEAGFPQEAETATAGRISMQVWLLGRNASGECAITRSGVNNTGDIQVSVAGNMIAIAATKLAPKAIIMGAAITPNGESTVNPPPQMYFEGAYEYTKLGQTVRKPLQFYNRGVTETKQ